ncbi:DUF4352 domain-containing protein [Salibacterium qingdaonense]|uniref:DUF4352 domain-containing protein n=1 Tax=Salibacterium qingdaonense TaxID=266892 RepID=A0A1I4K6E1_9BACI|nr:DUF4352 domain-containing protein [Salibacterium qingdaonense]SFL74352.1 protein of unknown function [Salibacterium qingdaonense]
MDKKLWLLLGLILILGFFSGMFIQSQRTAGDQQSFEQTASASSSGLLEIGETAEVGNFNITVHDAYVSSEQNSEVLVADLSFQNLAEDPQEIPLFNILVTDGDGHTYENLSSYDDQRLVGGQIRAGGLRRGTLAFEVDDSSHYELSYTNHSGSGLAAWNLAIPENRSAGS